MTLKLFQLFCHVHRREIISCFRRHGSSFCIIPREPLGPVALNSRPMPDANVTAVQLSCTVDHGTLLVEAHSGADLAVAEQWVKKHHNMPPEDFTWLPSFKESK